MKVIKNIKKKIKKIKKDIKIKNIQTINLKKISKITGLPIPKKYKKMANKELSEVTIGERIVSKNSILFVRSKYCLEDNLIDNIRNNATFVVTSEPIEGCNCIICEEPLEYAKKYYKYLRNLYNPKVIAVTGSIGKTSTKDVVGAVLKQKYEDSMTISQGNCNSTVYTAKYITQFNENIKVHLQEAGAGPSKNFVKNTAEILEANIAIYTNIRDSHIEYYGSRENIAKEKLSLSDYGKKKGLAIINYDDPILRNHKFKQKTYSYSLNNKEADFYADKIHITSTGTTFTIIDNIRNKKMKVELSVIGEQHVLNSIVGYIVGKELKMKNDLIKQGLKTYKTSGCRQNLINVGKYKVLADCFNSSYDALSFILKTFNMLETKRKGRKIAVIGDVFELGELSQKIHKDIGNLVGNYNFDKVFFLGENSKYAHEEYLKEKNNSFYAKNREELIKELKGYIKQDDIVLFKASHGMHFSEIIDHIFGTDIGEVAFINAKKYPVLSNEKYEYYLFENHASIKKYLGNEAKIKLPNSINGLPVEMIGNAAFINNKNIEEVELPEGLIRIRNFAFKNSSLAKIKIGKNLKSVGKSAFRSCKNLEEVILPEGLLFIEYKAFAECENLKKVYIPDTVKKMSDLIFHNSKNVVIECKKDSYAEKYARKRKMKYENV